MKITEAIAAADALSPNQFTLDEKLSWCNEVSLSLRRSVKKYYDVIETLVTCAKELELPDDISVDDVESVYVGGCLVDKVDLRSLPYLGDDELLRRFGLSSTMPQIMKVVYLTTPKEIEDLDIRGSFNLAESAIYGSELPFLEGDFIQCKLLDSLDKEPDWSDAYETYVLENNGEYLLISDELFTPQTEACLAIRRVMDDETQVEAPYDRMYIEYLLAKMALYQHDYDTYAAHMSQYNAIYDEYKRDYKNRSPMNDIARFKNYWTIG